MSIHPTSIISSEAEIASDVEIGPYCVVLGKVKIDSGCFLQSHVSIGSRYGIVEIGKNNRFSPSSIIGGAPQDITYKCEPTRLVIGDNNVFREFTSMNIATSKAEGITRIGNDNYFMAYTHVGHDCIVGNSVVIANDTHLGGHVFIDDFVKIGGVCCFNQFVKVGKYAFIAGDSTVIKDILPYSSAQGQGGYALCRATNKVGLERAGFSATAIDNIHRAIRTLLKGERTQQEAIESIQETCDDIEEIRYLLEFIETSQRGIAK